MFLITYPIRNLEICLKLFASSALHAMMNTAYFGELITYIFDPDSWYSSHQVKWLVLIFF